LATGSLFSAEPLAAAMAAILRGAGSSEAEAQCVAGNLVEANLTGHDSHGIGMLPRYVESLLEGGLAPNRHVSVELDTGVLLRLDGQHGYGQVVGREAMALGSERARRHGVCVVALANAHHLGRIGHFAEQCLEHGLVSLHFVNVVARPIVAAWGGKDARFGTNPVCIGIPRPGALPIVVDFATSRIAQGKSRIAYNTGTPVPPGSLLDDRGEPTTDARFSVVPPFGALLPLGEHKGYGLAIAAELLAGALTGGATCREPGAGKRRVHNGMLSVLLDPAQLGTSEHFAREAEAFLAWVKESPPVAGQSVQFAGEPEARARRQRAEHGIPVDANTWQEILNAAGKVGVEPAHITRTALSAAATA
jgi:hydroxycarboxylate dehydrogenase B